MRRAFAMMLLMAAASVSVTGCRATGPVPPKRVADPKKATPKAEPQVPVGRAEPPLPAGALRRLGSGLMPSWDYVWAVGFGCEGACYATVGRKLEAKWDTASGRLLAVGHSTELHDPHIVGGEVRDLDEDGCLSQGDEDIACIPDDLDPASFGCAIDPARIRRDLELCDADEYCDSLQYDEESPFRLGTAEAADAAPRVMAGFDCFDEHERRLGLFDVAKGRQIPLATLAPTGKAHFDRGYHVAISPRGDRVAFIDERWVVVDVEQDRVIWTLPKDTGSGPGHFSRDGKYFAVVGSREATVVNLETRKTVFESARVEASCYDPRQSAYVRNTFAHLLPRERLLLYTIDGRARVISLPDGAVEYEVEVCARHAAMNDAGTLLVVSTDEATEPLRYRPPRAEPEPRALADAPPATAKAVTISADGRIAASMVNAAVAWAWDVSTGKLLQRFERRSGGLQVRPLVTLSSNGKRLASAHRIGSLWDVDTGEYLAELDTDQHSFANDRFVFSPDDSLLTAATKEAVRIWDGRTGALLHAVDLPGAAGYDAAFVDDRRLLTADLRRVHLIDAFGGKLLFSEDLVSAKCPRSCSSWVRPRLHALGPNAFAVDNPPHGVDRVEIVDDRLTVVPGKPLPAPPTPPATPWAAAPDANLAVTADPASTAILVWPHPWPTDAK